GRRMIRPARAFALAGLLAAGAGACQGCRQRTRFSRGDAASVVVVAQKTADDLNTPLGEETEPNNTVNMAQLLPFGGDPLVAGVAGALPGVGKGADTDVFKIVVPGLGMDGGGSDAGADALTARRLIVDLRPDEGAS